MNNASPETITIITAVIGGAFGSGFLQFVQFLIQLFFTRKDKQLDKVEDIASVKEDMQEMKQEMQEIKQILVKTSDCVKGMAKNTIVHVSQKQVEQGYVTVDELDNMKGIYEPYKALGGNGTGETWYEEMNKLPRKSKN